MNIGSDAVCYLCNRRGPDELKRNCACVGEYDGVVHYPCLVRHMRAISDVWEGTDYTQYITPWKVCGVCNGEYRGKFAITMAVHCCQFVRSQHRQGLNWLQIESKYNLMCLQLALGRDMKENQRYEVGVTARLIISLIEYEWDRGAPRMTRYVGMIHNCQRAVVVMGLVDAGTDLQNDAYVMATLE